MIWTFILKILMKIEFVFTLLKIKKIEDRGLFHEK